MCNREPSASWWLVALFFLLALFSARTAWGDPTSIPSAQSTPHPSPLTISGWQSFDEAWTKLQAELIASAEDSTKLSALLLQLQTELAGLRSSLTQSDALLKLSGEALEVERQRAMSAMEALEAAQVSIGRWKAVAGVLGGMAGIFILISVF